VYAEEERSGVCAIRRSAAESPAAAAAFLAARRLAVACSTSPGTSRFQRTLTVPAVCWCLGDCSRTAPAR